VSANGKRRWYATACFPLLRSKQMSWTKPEAEVVAVTMEVTAYVATL
jgi:hypothetical protein